MAEDLQDDDLMDFDEEPTTAVPVQSTDSFLAQAAREVGLQETEEKEREPDAAPDAAADAAPDAAADAAAEEAAAGKAKKVAAKKRALAKLAAKKAAEEAAAEKVAAEKEVVAPDAAQDAAEVTVAKSDSATGGTTLSQRDGEEASESESVSGGANEKDDEDADADADADATKDADVTTNRITNGAEKLFEKNKKLFKANGFSAVGMLDRGLEASINTAVVDAYISQFSRKEDEEDEEEEDDPLATQDDGIEDDEEEDDLDAVERERLSGMSSLVLSREIAKARKGSKEVLLALAADGAAWKEPLKKCKEGANASEKELLKNFAKALAHATKSPTFKKAIIESSKLFEEVYELADAKTEKFQRTIAVGTEVYQVKVRQEAEEKISALNAKTWEEDPPLAITGPSSNKKSRIK